MKRNTQTKEQKSSYKPALKRLVLTDDLRQEEWNLREILRKINRTPASWLELNEIIFTKKPHLLPEMKKIFQEELCPAVVKQSSFWPATIKGNGNANVINFYTGLMAEFDAPAESWKIIINQEDRPEFKNYLSARALSLTKKYNDLEKLKNIFVGQNKEMFLLRKIELTKNPDLFNQLIQDNPDFSEKNIVQIATRLFILGPGRAKSIFAVYKNKISRTAYYHGEKILNDLLPLERLEYSEKIKKFFPDGKIDITATQAAPLRTGDCLYLIHNRIKLKLTVGTTKAVINKFFATTPEFRQAKHLILDLYREIKQSKEIKMFFLKSLEKNLTEFLEWNFIQENVEDESLLGQLALSKLAQKATTADEIINVCQKSKIGSSLEKKFLIKLSEKSEKINFWLTIWSKSCFKQEINVVINNKMRHLNLGYKAWKGLLEKHQEDAVLSDKIMLAMAKTAETENEVDEVVEMTTEKSQARMIVEEKKQKNLLNFLKMQKAIYPDGFF